MQVSLDFVLFLVKHASLPQQEKIGARPLHQDVPQDLASASAYSQQDLQSPLQHSTHLPLQHSAQGFLFSAWAEKLHPRANKAMRSDFMVILSLLRFDAGFRGVRKGLPPTAESNLATRRRKRRSFRTAGATKIFRAVTHSVESRSGCLRRGLRQSSNQVLGRSRTSGRNRAAAGYRLSSARAMGNGTRLLTAAVCRWGGWGGNRRTGKNHADEERENPRAGQPSGALPSCG